MNEIEPTIELLRQTVDLESLSSEWNGLLEQSAARSPFLTWEWLYPWWKHLGGRRRLELVAVRLHGRLIAVAPFCRALPSPRLLLPFQRIEFLGSGSAGSDYLDLIVRRGFEEPALEALAGQLSKNAAVVHLTGLQRNSMAHRLSERLRLRGWRSFQLEAGQCPFVGLDGLTWDSYLDGCSSSHRYTFRRKHRRLEARFRVEFESVTAPEQVRPALSSLIALHNQRWDERGGSDALHEAGLCAFHAEASRLVFERGWLRLYLLRLDGRAVAALYGFLYDDVFHFYQTGFDPAFSEWSVGLVTMGLSIRRAIEEGAREFDFLHGDEDYKFHWARHTRPLSRLELYPPQLRGAAYRTITEVGRATRAMARKLVTAGI